MKEFEEQEQGKVIKLGVDLRVDLNTTTTIDQPEWANNIDRQTTGGATTLTCHGYKEDCLVSLAKPTGSQFTLSYNMCVCFMSHARAHTHTHTPCTRLAHRFTRTILSKVLQDREGQVVEGVLPNRQQKKRFGSKKGWSQARKDPDPDNPQKVQAKQSTVCYSSLAKTQGE